MQHELVGSYHRPDQTLQIVEDEDFFRANKGQLAHCQVCPASMEEDLIPFSASTRHCTDILQSPRTHCPLLSIIPSSSHPSHSHPRPSPHFVPTSSQPSNPPYQSSATDSPCLPHHSVHSSFAVPQTPSSSLDPLQRTRTSVINAILGGSNQAGEKVNVLLSIKYGIPNTKPKPTTAIRIIGFLSKSSGETVCISRISITFHPFREGPPLHYLLLIFLLFLLLPTTPPRKKGANLHPALPS